VQYCSLFDKLLTRNVDPLYLRIMVNIYTGQLVKVLWNGVYSHNFPVINGVKQGSILSPVLFSVYIDELLLALRQPNVGCFMGSWFVGALAYADDIVLMALTATAVRRMLAVCDEFAVKLDVRFNASKSKCMFIRPRKSYKSHKHTRLVMPDLSIGGNNVEFVEKWPHLGHMISLNLSDDDDVSLRRQSLIGQINDVLCRFGR